MELKDIITIFGTLFTIAVAIKTLFFSSSKATIHIDGNNNTTKVTKVENITKNSEITNQYIIPQKTTSDSSNSPQSTEESVAYMVMMFLCVIIAIVLILTFNTYIMAILSVLLGISLLLNIKRIKIYDLSLSEIFLIIIEHIILSLIVFSALYMPEQIKSILDQFKPLNLNSFSLSMDWLIDSGKIIWKSITNEELVNVGIVLLLRIMATILITVNILDKFSKKSFVRKIQKCREREKSNYFSLILLYVFLVFILHSSFVYYPLKELMSPVFKKVGDDVRNWFSK